MPVLMSCGCYNKLLQSERFENNMSVLSYSSGGQKSEMGLKLKSRCWKGWFLLEALGKHVFSLFRLFVEFSFLHLLDQGLDFFMAVN